MSLQDALACLEARSASTIRVEGHTDDRGSDEYNIALGQRRAQSVRSYLGNLGFSSGSIKTVSYGEEQPNDRGQNEAAWARNRRVEITIVD